jgi:hypothetical protein
VREGDNYPWTVYEDVWDHRNDLHCSQEFIFNSCNATAQIASIGSFTAIVMAVALHFGVLLVTSRTRLNRAMARFSCDYRGSDREPCVLGLNDVEEHMMVDCRRHSG